MKNCCKKIFGMLTVLLGFSITTSVIAGKVCVSRTDYTYSVMACHSYTCEYADFGNKFLSVALPVNMKNHIKVGTCDYFPFPLDSCRFNRHSKFLTVGKDVDLGDTIVVTKHHHILVKRHTCLS